MLVGEGIAAKMGWMRGQTVPLSSNIFVRSDGAKSWQVRIAGIFKSRRPAATANDGVAIDDLFRAFHRERT